jgi:enolase-phosphatase E1
VTIRLIDRGIQVVLLDIEGTTTPLTFVHDVLFPFARAHLAGWLRDVRASEELSEVVDRLSAEHGGDLRRGELAPPWHDETPAALEASIERYVLWLMDRDRKSPGLKLLQGLIWERGYQAGTLRGEVYADVPPAVRRWSEAGMAVAIYSSGSELAQRRLFASTPHGDLSPWISGFFDTSIGAKRDTESYTRIAAALGRPPHRMLFLSDVTSELSAARGASCQAVLCVRPGNPAQPDASAFDGIASFDEIT